MAKKKTDALRDALRSLLAIAESHIVGHCGQCDEAIRKGKSAIRSTRPKSPGGKRGR